MEPIYFKSHSKEIIFLKGFKATTITAKIADTFPSLPNKEKINIFFQDKTAGEYNIVRLCLIPDEEYSEKILRKCFPLYASGVIQNIQNCQGIQFHARKFGDNHWLSHHGFRLIKEKYPNIFLLLDINSAVLGEIEYKADVLAEKVLRYREYIDAVVLNLYPKNFKDVIAMEGFKKEIIKFLKSFHKKLH